MKRYLSFLSILAIVCSSNFANASDCVGEDCDIETFFDEEIDVLQPMEQTENLWSDYTEDYTEEEVVVEQPVVSVDEEIIVKEDEEDVVEYVDGMGYCGYDYNCPFDTVWECNVWYKKPVYKETVAPRSPHLNPVKIDGIINMLTFQGYISANDALAKPLLERYQMMMRASNACCSEGIIYKLRNANKKDKKINEKIYEFLKDDANEYNLGERCLVMTNGEIYDAYSYGLTGEMVADVRNLCLCKNRQWFDTLLEPFYDLYQTAPEFQSMPFSYTYLDSMQREKTVSVNQDVQNVMDLLGFCPD